MVYHTSKLSQTQISVMFITFKVFLENAFNIKQLKIRGQLEFNVKKIADPPSRAKKNFS